MTNEVYNSMVIISFLKGGHAMKNGFVLIMKWIAPIVIITIAVLHFTDIAIPKWPGIILLLTIAVLYTIALIIEKRNYYRR